MKEIKAPDSLVGIPDIPRIFLAGSIEMGKAEEWQKRVVKELEQERVVLLNPRRDDWDPSWKQSISNSKFKEQVEWELDMQDKADLIFMNFVPGTNSPISLLELGLAKSKRIWVCCPEGFHREGNVEIVCKRYSIPLYETLREMILEARVWCQRWDPKFRPKGDPAWNIKQVDPKYRNL